MLSSSSEVAFCKVCKHFMKVMESTTSVTPGLFLHAVYLEYYASRKDWNFVHYLDTHIV